MCSVRLARLFVFLAAIILTTASVSAAAPDSETKPLKKLENRAEELAEERLNPS